MKQINIMIMRQLFSRKESCSSNNKVMDISSTSGDLFKLRKTAEESKEVSCFEDENLCQGYRSTNLFKAMSPFFMSMKLLGLFHCRDFDLKYSNENKQKPMKCTLPIPVSLIYSAYVVVLLTANLLRSLNAFSVSLSYSPETFGNIMVIMWYVQCANSSIVCFRASYQFSHLPKFFLHWDKIHEKDKNLYCLVFCRKMVYIYIIVCWFLVAVNMTASGCMLYFTKTMEIVLTPFTYSHSLINIIIGLYLVLHLYLSAAWIFPMGMYYIICKVLFKEFRRFNKNLQNILHNKTEQFPSEFEEMRQKHQQICNLVSNADDILATYNAVAVVQCCFNICLVMYNLIWYEDVRRSNLSLGGFLFWLCCAVLNLGMICVGGAIVNEEVSELLR